MYRDSILALEARLAHLREVRAALDADIATSESLLRAWRRALPRPGRRWWQWTLHVIVPALVAGLLVMVAIIPRLDCELCRAGSTTRASAATIRSAATLYLAQSSDSDCPTVEELVHEGYLGEDTAVTDGWGHPYWVSCDRGDVSVRSERFDGESLRPGLKGE